MLVRYSLWMTGCRMGISGVKLCREVLGSELSKVQDEQNNPVHPGQRLLRCAVRVFFVGCQLKSPASTRQAIGLHQQPEPGGHQTGFVSVGSDLSWHTNTAGLVLSIWRVREHEGSPSRSSPGQGLWHLVEAQGCLGGVFGQGSPGLV